MPTFGRYEATRELEMTALGSVWAATLAGSSRAFVVKSYRPDPIVMRPGEVERALASFLDRAELQRKTLAAGGQRWAPIHDVGRFPEGAYYVTDSYALTAEKLIGRNTKLDAFSMFSIVGGVVRGLMELKKACARPHGNLKASNVLLERSKPHSPPRVFLSDMADASRVSEEGSEANDLDALGQLIFQLVMHRAWVGMDAWPIPPTPEWQVLGAKADKWRELCNLLLHPSPAQGLRQVDALPKLIAALKPKRRGAWLRRLAFVTILFGGTGAGGFYYLQSRPELARSLLTRLRVALHIQPRTPPSPTTNEQTNPPTTGTAEPTMQVVEVDSHVPSNTNPATRDVEVVTNTHPSTTKPVTRPTEVATTTEPSTRAVEPTTRVVIATSHPSTTAPASRPTAVVSTTTTGEAIRAAIRIASIATAQEMTRIAAAQATTTQLASSRPSTRPATQVAGTQPTTRTATTQPTSQPATQIATPRVATTSPATKATTQLAINRPATQIAATQASTRPIGPSTSVATTGPTSRPTTLASSQPATRDVKPRIDPAQVVALGRWTEAIVRRGFGPAVDAGRKTLGGMERLKTQLDELQKQRLAQTKKQLALTAKETGRDVQRDIDAARKAEAAKIEAARQAETTRRMEEARKAEEARVAEAARMAKEAKALALREGLTALDAEIVVSPMLKGSLATAAQTKRGQLLEKTAAAAEKGTVDKVDAPYRAAVRHEYERWLRGELQKRAAELLDAAKVSAGGLEDSPAKVSALAEVAVAQMNAGRATEGRGTMAAARKVAGLMNKATRGSVYRDLARPLAEVGEAPAAKAMVGNIPRAAWKAEALRDIAAVQAKAGKFDDALATAASITESREQAEAYGLIGAAQATAGDSAGAQTTVAKIPKPYDRISALLGVADAEAAVQRIPMARSSVNEARKLVTQIDDADFKSRTLRWVIGAEARLGNIPRAKTEAKNLTETYEKALAYQSIAAAQVAAGELAGALQTLGDAEVAASAIRDSHERDEVLREIAVTQAEAGNPSVARRTAAGIRDTAAQAVVNRAIAVAQAHSGDLAAANKTLALMAEGSEKALAYRAVAEEQAKGGDEDKIAAFLATVANPYQKSFAQVGSARAWIKLADQLAPARE